MPAKNKPISFDDFTSDQIGMLDAVCSWYKNASGGCFKSGGVAGSGKTTVIANLAVLMQDRINRYPRIAYCAFTGKAAKVMRDKGMTDASTIHSLIYHSSVALNEKTQTLEYTFGLKEKKMLECDLIVVDEASTVSQELSADLTRFGIPILYVGDYAQLPPVGNDINLMEEKELNYKLTKIHRQAENSGIIRLSMAVRNGDAVAFHKSEDTERLRLKDVNMESLCGFDQIICGKNATRVWLNREIRKIYGFNTQFPERKDKMIFLHNNKQANVYNGQQFIVLDAKSTAEGDFLVSYVDIYNKEGGVQKARLLGKVINSPNGMKDLKLTRKEWEKKPQIGDFSYAISSYKSQGSEWPSVCLWDDNFGSWDEDIRRRHLYTCITRASEKFTWVSL